MSDEYAKRASARLQQEYAELDNPIVSRQLVLDRLWQMRLDERAAARRRIERPGAVDPGSGIYDPMRRFEDEF